MQFRPYRLWSLAFAAFFLMISAWALAAPYDAAADEHEHIYRAVGVVSGEVAPKPEAAVRGSGAYQTVPNGLVREMCWHWRKNVSAACAVPPSADRTPTRVGSGAGRYNPVYYAFVGWPLKLWPGWPGLYLARLISGAAAAALLAGAVVTIFRYTRYRLMMAGLLVAVTPTSLHFFGSVNPNGLEIAAGVGLFAAMIPLVLGRFNRLPRGVVGLAGISALALATLRPTGLMYLAVAAVAFLVPLRRELLARFWRSRAARWWVVAVTVAAVSAVIWIIAMRSADLGGYFKPPHRYSAGQAAVLVVHLWGDWVEQMIAIFNWLETRPPQGVFLAWEFAAGALLVLGVSFGRWVDRWRLAVVFVGGVVLPSVMQVAYVNVEGFVTQGRYMLPMLVGLMLLAAYVTEQGGLPTRPGRAVARLFVLALLPIHLFCLVLLMARWQRGLPDYGHLGVGSLNPFGGSWQPVLTPATPLLAMITGLLLLGWLAGVAPGRWPTGAAAELAEAGVPAVVDGPTRTATPGDAPNAAAGGGGRVALENAAADGGGRVALENAAARRADPAGPAPDGWPAGEAFTVLGSGDRLDILSGRDRAGTPGADRGGAG